MESRISLRLLGAICLWVFGPAVLAAQLTIWLKTGEWPPWTFGDGCAFVGLPRPVTDWTAAQQVCDWIWSWPLWLGLLVTTALFAALLPGSRRN